MWYALFKPYWQVTVFKQSPANTPYSPLLLIFSALLYLMFTLFQWSVSPGLQKHITFNFVIVLGLGLLFVYYAYTAFLLQVKQRTNRLVQTLTSLFASHFIIHVITFPLAMLAPQLVGLDTEIGLNLLIVLVYIIITLGLTIWQFLITAFIYRQALNIDFLASLLASFGLSVCNILIALAL